MLYFDILNMGFFDQLRVYDSADEFITSRMTPADMVAVMVFENGSVRPEAGLHRRPAPRSRA